MLDRQSPCSTTYCIVMMRSPSCKGARERKLPERIAVKPKALHNHPSAHVMANFVYSIKITLESVKIKDPDDGDVYFIARVDGTSKGRSKIFSMGAGDTAD